MGAFPVVEGDPVADHTVGSETVGDLGRVDRLLLHRPPKTLDEDIVQAPPAPVHRNTDTRLGRRRDPRGADELRTLVRVHNLLRAISLKGFIQRLAPLPGMRFAKQICREGQQSACIVFDCRQFSTLRVAQSMIATR